jgi:hypothetical protein
MRYMYLVIGAQDYGPPPQRLMDEMTKLTERRLADGSMIDSGGLLPTPMGAARVSLKGGKLKVTDGPFTESKEVVGGYAIFEFATREEALASAMEFMELHRLYAGDWEGTCEMRPMFGMEQGSVQPHCAPSAQA